MLKRKNILIIGLVLSGLYFLLTPSKRLLKIPYPYKMEPLKKQSFHDDAVWFGSEYATKVSRYLPNLEKRLKNEGQSIKIKDMSQNHFGLHRFIQGLKRLEPFPKLILYYGNSQEASEFKFNLFDQERIRENLKKYSSSEFQKILNDNKGYSNFEFFKYQNIIELKDPQVNSFNLKPEQKAAYLATLYALYEMEVKELVSLVKKNNSQIIFVTTPLKLKENLVHNCSAFEKNLSYRMQRLNEMVQSGDFKKAYQMSKGLLLKYKGYSELYYMHALISEGLDRYGEALENFNQAQMFNCNLYGPKPAYNNILRAAANRYQIPLFDFDNFLQEKFITSSKKLKTNHISNSHYKSLIESLEYLTLQALRDN